MLPNDAILLAMSPSALHELVDAALVACRDAPLTLGESSLAQSSLLMDCLFSNESLNWNLQRLGMRALLRWVVDKLRPDGEPNWLDESWQPYLCLHCNYFTKEKFSTIAYKMALSDKSIFNRRDKGISRIAQIIRYELQTKVDCQTRKTYLIVERYRAHTADEQALLGLIAIFRQPLRLGEIEQLAKQAKLSCQNGNLDKLLRGGLLTQDKQGDVQVHSDVRPLLVIG